MKKIAQRVISSLLLIMLFAPLFTGCDNRKETRHSLELVGGTLCFDSVPFKIGSVSLDYARLPREYWQQRLRLVKGLGVNTILVRVPWMLHEPVEGTYCFEGECDVREFCRIAQDNGLLVWLHVGPYVDSHLDFGGMPWWLLCDEKMNVRSRQKVFMDKVGKYFRALAAELAPAQLSRGGNIALIQIEEPVALPAVHKGYLSALCDSIRDAGFNETLLTVATAKENLHQMPIDKAVVAFSIDENEPAMGNFTGARKYNPNAPILCYDVSRQCSHVWGERVLRRNLDRPFARLFEVFEGAGSANLSVGLGGTSYGHLAGAEITDGRFRPYSTSYDNNCIFNESGRYRESITIYRDAFLRSATQLQPAKAEAEIIELSSLPETAVTSYAPLLDSLPSAVKSSTPMTFEQLGLGYGAVLYSTTLPKIDKGTSLCIDALHDNAQILVDGKRVAAVQRADKEIMVALPETEADSHLQIIVDAFGRVANIPSYKDYKGIIGKVSLVGSRGARDELSEWENIPLPAEYEFASARTFGTLSATGQQGYYRTKFTLPVQGDLFLYMGEWGRGEVWVNGHSLGRFCGLGAQKTLYVPGCWMKDADNELLILDWQGPKIPVIEGFKTAILD